MHLDNIRVGFKVRINVEKYINKNWRLRREINLE